jgi:hypothetical protein
LREAPRFHLEIVALAKSGGAGGGARRNRTADLFNAIEALSQLSYDPGRLEIARVP